MQITGISLTPGVYTGIDGKTVEYPEEIVHQIIDSMPGKPILWAHTQSEDGKDLKYKAVGYFVEAWPQGNSAMYKGHVYNPEVFPLIEDRTLHSGSLELSLQAEYDEARDLYVARRAQVEAMTLTDRPAVKGAKVLSHDYVTQVMLEAWPGTQKGGSEMSSDQNDQNLADLAAGYPRPETTPWGEMSDKEKYQTCVTFFKNKGYSMPAKEEELEKIKKQAQEEFEALAEAVGIDLESYRQFMSDCMKSGKSMKECALEWKKKQKTQQEEDPEIKKLKERVAHFEKMELERLVADIKSIDKNFDEKKLLTGLETYEQKRAILERYKSFLAEHKPKVKLEIGESDDVKTQLEARRKRLAEEMLPPDLLSLVYGNQGGNK